MFEVELKAVVDDLDLRRQRMDAAGAELTFEGRLSDKRYDLPSRALAQRDEVLRVRRYETTDSVQAHVDWKGPTDSAGAYKVREEISTVVADFKGLSSILEKLGYVVTREIDRRVVQYRCGAATVRFEVYPRMDVLVEVEGEPPVIEDAIAALGMLRGEFTTERLAVFVDRFERRTGVRAAISDRELVGDYALREAEGSSGLG
ncbi:MAG TPA: class IV adenylate cyclase [Gemmatimonadaceae bacterium]|nr:class IV adenylate cyclase [Gemmatimonadaceae bacterium]